MIQALEYKINNLEARCRFYERIIVKLNQNKELSTGEFTTVIQILKKYKVIELEGKNKK